MIHFPEHLRTSDFFKREPFIILSGLVSEFVYQNIQDALPTGTAHEEKLSKVFFVNYSEKNIASGVSFERLFVPTTRHVEATACTLVGITQQFGKPFEYIPAGWKTICKIKFGERIPDLVKHLPVVDDWFENLSDPLMLSSELFWKKFNGEVRI